MSYTDSKAKALAIGASILDKKGEDILVLDVRKVSSFCDYFVITSAGSLKKTRAIADHIEEMLAKEIRPHHVEGRQDSNWILLDYGDVVCHIFYQEARNFYGLERLWGDAQQIAIKD